jgi:hypothetical protein
MEECNAEMQHKSTVLKCNLKKWHKGLHEGMYGPFLYCWFTKSESAIFVRRVIKSLKRGS